MTDFARLARAHPECAIGATYQTVSSALRMQVMAAAEYDRDGTIQGGGGAVDVDTGQVRSRGAPAGDTGRMQRAQMKGRRKSRECRQEWMVEHQTCTMNPCQETSRSVASGGCKGAQCPKCAAAEAAGAPKKSQQKEEVRG